MPPQSEESTLNAGDILEKEPQCQPVSNRTVSFNWEEILQNLLHLDYSKVVWGNVLKFIILHVFAIYGLFLLLLFREKWQTFFFVILMIYLSLFGITMGAHRLWAHKTFKATFPLRVVLAICQTIAAQNDIYEWSRDHRVHHKFSETDGDPHNAKRGLFFAHMGWLLYKKHDDVKTKGKKVDCSDLLQDPIVRFQQKYFLTLAFIFCALLPTAIPFYFWNEDLLICICCPFAFRYAMVLHGTWCVNSFAHWVGNRPYNSYIYPAQTRWVSWVTGGEGWHNYHHTFPFDYRAAELGGFSNYNIVKNAIEFCEKIGLAYDLKTVEDKTVHQKATRYGDGSFRGVNVSNY